MVFFTGSIKDTKLGSYQKLAAEILQKAEFTSEKTRLEAEHERKEKMFELQKQFENTWQSERRKIQQEESRLKQREDKLEERINLMEKKLFQIEKREGIVVEANSELHEERKNLAHLKEKTKCQIRRSCRHHIQGS